VPAGSGIAVGTLLGRLARLCALLAALTTLIALGAAWWTWQSDPPVPPTAAAGAPQILHIDSVWVGDRVFEPEVADLARRARAAAVTDVIVRTSLLSPDGRLGSYYPFARDFLRYWRPHAGGVRVLAEVHRSTSWAYGPLDPSDELVRQALLKSCERLLRIGFDGIHLRLAPVPAGDRRLLGVLDVLRGCTTRAGAVLSVSVEPLELVPEARPLLLSVLPAYDATTAAFLTDITDRSDQLLVRADHTPVPFAWLHGLHVAWQTEHVARAVGDRASVAVSVGDAADALDRVQSGVRGVAKGRAAVPNSGSERVGIALFAGAELADDEIRVLTGGSASG
jgi:hypothetical protein